MSVGRKKAAAPLSPPLSKQHNPGDHTALQCSRLSLPSPNTAPTGGPTWSATNGDAQLATLSADGKVLAVNIDGRSAAVFARNPRNGAWGARQAANVDLLGGDAPPSAIVGLHLSSDGAWLAALGADDGSVARGAIHQWVGAVRATPASYQQRCRFTYDAPAAFDLGAVLDEQTRPTSLTGFTIGGPVVRSEGWRRRAARGGGGGGGGKRSATRRRF